MAALSDRELGRRAVLEARLRGEDEMLVRGIEAEQARAPRAGGRHDVVEEERRRGREIRCCGERGQQGERPSFTPGSHQVIRAPECVAMSAGCELLVVGCQCAGAAATEYTESTE